MTRETAIVRSVRLASSPDCLIIIWSEPLILVQSGPACNRLLGSSRFAYIERNSNS
jgi:hypothetical protein